MAEVDTSMYRPVQQPSPLDLLSTAAGVANAVQQNKLLRQESGARQAIGDLYSGATDANGTIDYNKILGSAGTAGYMAPEVAHAAMANEAASQELARTQANDFWNAAGSLAAAHGGQVTAKDVHGLAADWLAQGRIDPRMYKTLVDQVPTEGGNLRSFVTGRYETTLPAGIVTGAVTGPPTASGAPTAQTGGQFIGQTIGGNQPLQTGMEPGYTEAKTASGQGSGQLLSTDRAAAANYRAAANPLEQAIPILEKLGPTGQGVGSEELNTLRNFAVSWGIADAATADKTKLYEEARKYLTQEVRANGDTGTNDKLAAAFAGTPNMKITNASAIDLAKAALAQRRIKAAQPLIFDDTGQAPDKYASWSAKWAASTDPRAFGWDLMSPEQRSAVWKSIPAGKRDAFKAAVGAATKYGLMNAPEAANGAQ